MKKTTYKSATQYLKNFGFMVTEHESNQGKCCYAEKEESSPTLINDCGRGLVFLSKISWTKYSHMDGDLLLFLVNTLNSDSKCSSYTLLDDLAIKVKAVYMGSYSKEKFAEFLEDWAWDTTELIFSDSSSVIMHLMNNSNELAHA